MEAGQRLTESVIGRLEAAVEDSGGNELFVIGKVDEQGVVHEIDIAARGDEQEVPALAPFLERGDVVIHNHPSGILTPSKADLRIASRLGDQGIGFFIISNTADRVYVVSEPVQQRRRIMLETDKILSVLEPGGIFSKTVSFYEPRQSQIEMTEHVAGGFNDDKIVAIEAGTGVGKSMAYLLPALSWVEQNDERVVISTATINLQQQLLDKDIPLVQKLLGSSVKTVLVKGRGNYICLRRLEERLEENALFREEDDELIMLADWVKAAKGGSRSELSVPIPDEVWFSVNSETVSCLGLRCPHREDCFVLRARREAASAKILVANHHLLFSDLAMRLAGAGYDNAAVLPPFSRIIFDEAHNIEPSATSFFSEQFSRFSLLKQLNRLYRKRRNRTFGLIVRARRLLGNSEHFEKIPGLIEQIKEQSITLNNTALRMLQDERAVWVKGDEETETLSLVIAEMVELQSRIIDLVHVLVDIQQFLEDKEEEQYLLQDLKLVALELEYICSICSRFREVTEYPESVFWLERRGSKEGEQHVVFIISPLSIASMMQEALFDRYGTIICTSATLTVKDRFSFWMKQIGMDRVEDERIESVLLQSPFPYRQNVLLAVPADAPPPDNESYPQYLSRVTAEVLSLSEGRGLVLFTSYALLNKVYEAVQPALSSRGITVLKQGEADRAKLLHDFTFDVASVLFATASFWEGIDAPGETLKVVIITRLPFKVPTGPVFRARMEAIEKSGGNSFFQLALPEAVMKFKQGFGRLMRRQTDHGIVLVLDSRIVSKSYGQTFLQSLPETVQSIKPGVPTIGEIENFLYPAQV